MENLLMIYERVFDITLVSYAFVHALRTCVRISFDAFLYKRMRKYSYWQKITCYVIYVSFYDNFVEVNSNFSYGMVISRFLLTGQIADIPI